MSGAGLLAAVSLFAIGQLDLSHAPSSPLVQVYAKSGEFSGAARAYALFEDRVGVGAALGAQRRKGAGVAPVGDPPSTTLWQAPLFVEGILRLSLRERQPVVPYLRGGIGAVLWWETVGTETLQGAKAAAQVGGGLQLRMPLPEVDFRGSLFGVPEITGVYASIEGWARSADSFGRPGLDLTAYGIGFAIAVQFSGPSTLGRVR